jgi:hypothetical protein
MRGISLTYGQTTIDGGFIRTGEISSLDGITKFNLNTGVITGKITFAAGSSGYANISDKPILGTLSGLNLVEQAQLGTTVISGGYLNTSLIDANYIRTIDLIATKVTTGKLQSVNTLNYFDLDNNKFKLGNAMNYMDWNVTTPNVLTIKGHITADSGTISGVTINANDQFSLNGSKVEILPNAGMRVFGGGYADFTNSTLKVPTAAASGLASGEAALWIGSLSGVASGASGGSVATLSDVALSGLASGQILVWNGSTWVNQNNVPAVDLSAYYTKTETQNFFSGASSMSGYNKSNWDSAYAASHSHANKAFLDGITSGATVGINVSGDAARTPLLVGLGSYVWNASTPATSYSLGITNSFVSHVEGFPAYGSLMNMKTYDGGSAGGTLQLFTPYGNSFPSINLRYRLSDYNTGAWSGWKILANTEDLAAYLPLTGGTLSSWLQVNSYLATTGHIHSGGRVYVDGGTSYYITSGTSILNGLYLAGSLTYNSNVFNNSTPAHTDNPAMSIKLYDEYSSGTAPQTYGTVLDIHGRSSHNHTQIFFGSSGTDIYVRNAFYGSTTWNGWKRLMNSDNVGSYAPSLTGVGASGTWNIGISGTSANSSQLNYWPYTSYAYRNGGTGYYQVNDWIQLNTTAGIFWPSYYGAHITVNTASSYTQLQIIGSKGSYGGIYDSYSGVNIGMYDSAGNGGIYRETNGRWILYHHISNDCLGIGTSTTYAGYKMYIGGALRVGSSTYSETSISAGTYINAGSSIAANTTINAGTSMTAPDFYANGGWFRNNSQYGLYNSVYGGHFSQVSINYWSINGGTTAPMGLEFRSGFLGTTYGYVYADGSNFGLLYGGSWAVRTFSGGGELTGNWSVTGSHTIQGSLSVGSTAGTSGFYHSPTSGTIIGSYSASPWPGLHNLYVQGKVGIGTSTLSYQFNVQSSASDWAGVISSSANGSAVYFANGAGYGMHINAGSNAASSTYIIEAYSNGSQRMRLWGDGVLLLGVGERIDTSTLLQVKGNARTSGYIYSESVGYFGGDVIAYYSDSRLKTIKGNITNALAMLHQVDGVHYEANDLAVSIGAVKEKKNEVGLIAQQWQSFMPEVLALAPFDMDGNGGSKSGLNYMTMKYERTVPLIIEAIKEVDNKYTREIAALKNEMSFLQTRVADLERRLN